MQFNFVQNDITKMETDTIVNAANSRLLMGGGMEIIMKKLCLFILSILTIFASGCNRANTYEKVFNNVPKQNNVSEQSVVSDSGEQNIEQNVEQTVEPKKEHIGSKFMGVWYYTAYSDPQYAEDFEKIEIVPYGETQAKVSWSDGRENIFEVISENEGVGAYGELEKAQYYVDDENGAEHFNVTVAEGGPIFQSGAGGYRTVPSIYEPKAEKKKTELKSWFNTLSQKEIPDDVQMVMNQASGELYKEWDRLLNEIYGYLEDTMPQNEFATLQTDEQNWIKQKEKAMKDEEIACNHGSITPLAVNSLEIEYIKERCEYLLSLIK